MQSYLILYNPQAGNGRGEENALTIQNILPEGSLTFRDMTRIGDYREFFSTLPRETSVVICGGDGTLNRFLNDTAGLSLQDDLFYYPGGSGNDFLRDVAREGGPRLIRLKEYMEDLPQVTVNGKSYRFLNGIGYGIDGYCCQVGDELRESSAKKVNYTAIAIKGLLFHYKPTNAGNGGRAEAYIQKGLAGPHHERPLLWRQHDADSRSGPPEPGGHRVRHGHVRCRKAEDSGGVPLHFQGRARAPRGNGGGPHRP